MHVESPGDGAAALAGGEAPACLGPNVEGCYGCYVSEQASSKSGRLIRVTLPGGKPSSENLFVVAIDDDRLALDFIRAALGVTDADTEVVGDVSAGTLSALNLQT